MSLSQNNRLNKTVDIIQGHIHITEIESYFSQKFSNKPRHNKACSTALMSDNRSKVSISFRFSFTLQDKLAKTKILFREVRCVCLYIIYSATYHQRMTRQKYVYALFTGTFWVEENIPFYQQQPKKNLFHQSTYISNTDVHSDRKLF